MKDLIGREYAKLSQLKAGDKVTLDEDLGCVSENDIHTVEAGEYGALFIPCTAGKHFLDGQLDDVDGDSLVGVYLVET